MGFPISFYIALRYATTNRYKGFISFINRFSVAGIALGLCSLIVVLSVMNGFEQQLKNRILGIVPHIVADATPEQITTQELKAVTAVMPFREAQGVVQAKNGLRGVQFHGVEPKFMMEHAMVATNMVRGRFDVLRAGEFGVIVGQALASQLDIRVGDEIRLMAAGVSIYTPFGRMPSQRLVTVVGIYNMQSQMDDKVIYLHHHDLRKLERVRDETPDKSRIFLTDAFNYLDVQRVLTQQGIASVTWRARQGPLFDAVKMEKNMMAVMLVLIIAVAAFNVVSALVMVVSEKRGDVAILQTLGMTQTQIRWIFLLNGMLNGVKGALIGVVGGILLATQINPLLAWFNIPIALSAEGFGVPVELVPYQVATVTCLTLCLCLVASIYPAIRASNILPAVALQNE